MRRCLFALVLGCGFQGIQNLNAPPDQAKPIADLAGVDFAGAAVDLAMPVAGSDLAVATGPGPLGALPAGYCCDNDEQCRSRLCVTTSNPSYCADECGDDATCTVWGPGFTCDQGSGQCAPLSTPYSCHPAQQFQHGSKAIGTCCVSGIATSGQECLGGLCRTTGNDGNPFYCTQGCDGNTPCPGGYQCFAAFCWISQTVGDPSYLYMCQ